MKVWSNIDVVMKNPHIFQYKINRNIRYENVVNFWLRDEQKLIFVLNKYERVFPCAPFYFKYTPSNETWLNHNFCWALTHTVSITSKLYQNLACTQIFSSKYIDILSICDSYLYMQTITCRKQHHTNSWIS